MYPMTMDELKESGVAQVLQAIRHQLNNRLRKRVRFVIKAWQKLIDPGPAGVSVIPAQLRHPSNGDNDSRSTNTVNGLPNPTPPDGANSSLAQNSNGGVKSQLKQPSWDTVSNNDCIHHESPVRNPAKRIKTSESFASDRVPSPHPPSLPNGRSPKPPQENGRVSSGSAAPKLSKVKSTAELIQEAGLFIDPATKDRILSNRIAKESDEVIHVAPLAAMRASRRSRVQRQQEKQQQQQQQSQQQSRSRRKSVDRATHPSPKSASVSILPTLAEESPSSKHSTRPPIPPIKLDRIHSLIKQESNLSVSPDHNHRHQHNHLHHKEKRKKPEPNECGGAVKWEAEEGDKKPLPNHMDDIPALPSLTDEMRHLQQENALVSYNSARTPDETELADLGRVDDLIQGSWEEVSASRDEEGNLHPMTEMYSVPLNQEDWMHILPWINMDGYRQTFFPPGFNTSEDIDRLIDLPEPW
ncbi:hypothetical protein Aperf_G00000017997 [Anoplocephala perfoliata]